MALTSAERAKRYREKLKLNKEKYEVARIKQLERVKKGLKKIRDLSDREKEKRRKYWRELKKKTRNSKKLAVEVAVPSTSRNSRKVDRKKKHTNLANKYNTRQSKKLKTLNKNLRKTLNRTKEKHQKKKKLKTEESVKLKAGHEFPKKSLGEKYKECKSHEHKMILRSMGMSKTVLEKRGSKAVVSKCLGLKSGIRFSNNKKYVSKKIKEEMEVSYSQNDISRSTSGKPSSNSMMNTSHSYKMKESATEHGDSKAKSTPIAMVAPELKQHADINTEITKTCAVLGCEDFKNLDAESFFRFPEDLSLRQIWTDLTGRNNWTPTDFSYICMQHFSIDCFKCDEDNQMVLVDKAVPSLKLPRHVLEVEYIDEETLDNEEDDDYMTTDEDMEKDASAFNNTSLDLNIPQQEKDSIELLKLFTDVQRLQRQAVGLKDKLKYNMKVHNRQNRFLKRIKEIIEMKKKVLNQKRKKKCRILLSLQDKIKEDSTGLVLAMPMRQTEDLKNFALSIYKYSPQAYIYIRNTLRTMLPSTEILDSWITAGYQPRNVVTNSNLIKVVAEQTDTQLSCKVMIG